MGWAGSALLALATALLVAQLGPYVAIGSTRWQPGQASLLFSVVRRHTVSMTGVLHADAAGSTPEPAAPVEVGAAGPVESHSHEPLITNYLSATGLKIFPASPQHHPATHVLQLPMAGVAPLSGATIMPSDLDQLSSKGFQTFMFRTVEFFQVGLFALDLVGVQGPYKAHHRVYTPSGLVCCHI
jgi:hypothetical protein